MVLSKGILVIIVGYRNPDDIKECLATLQDAAPEPEFDVFICENGGNAAFEATVSGLVGADGPCTVGPGEELYVTAARFAQVKSLRFRHRNAQVHVAEAAENLGYAGAINQWLQCLLAAPGWVGIWILNPDTQPHPRALAELVAWSAAREKGMVGSRLVFASRPEAVQSRGLCWRRFKASTDAVDYGAPAAVEPDPDRIEQRLDAPSGASMFVRRACVERIGLMDESYFLYFEDLDWGYRAKRCCGIGYAYRSIVPHRGGTTIGSAGRRAARSTLSVYLEFRNRIHFVRRHHPGWLLWTVMVLALRTLEYVAVGAPANFRAACRGLLRGVAGETGRPEMIPSHP